MQKEHNDSHYIHCSIYAGLFIQVDAAEEVQIQLLFVFAQAEHKFA